MSSGLDEARLARAAAAGDGQAFARLYDSYERRIYTFCHRLVGNEQDAQDATQDAFLKVLQRLPKLQDRELNFGAYLFTAARNASYDVIGKRKKADAVDEIPETGARPVYGDGAPLEADPERAAMLGSLQESVRGANGRLPERQREVLALRELEELSYDEIAEIMDMNRNSVAQLISRARIKLRDELRGSALASIAVSSPDCERALPLLSMRQDGQLGDGDDRDWLTAHLDGCDTCKVSVDAMEEAGISYRAWTPVVPAAFLFRDTMAKAAELCGADWSDIGRPGADGADGGGGPHDGPAAGSAGGDGAAAGTTEAHRVTVAGTAAGATATAAAQDDGKRRRRGLLAALLAAFLLIGTASVALVTGSDDPPQDPTLTAEPVDEALTPPTTTQAPATTAPTATTTSARRKRRMKTMVVEVAPGVTRTIQVPVDEATPPTTTQPKKRGGSGTLGSTGGGGGGGQSGGGRDPLKGTPTPTPGPSASPAPTAAPEPTPAATAEPTPAPTPTPVDCRQNPRDPACQGTGTTPCNPSTGAGCSTAPPPRAAVRDRRVG